MSHALIGYLVTRGWTTQRIAHTVNMSEAQVKEVISAIRRTIRVMFVLIADSYGETNPLTMRVQILWHLLTGISPKFAGLAALPNVRHWVLINLTSAGITSLASLLALKPEQFPQTSMRG